ncbi:MAG TPA: hypothetical protein HA362_02865 [Nanoarchaeota archaeon]|nr:hypothetical protein [Nanoarchaeota archaeon]
MPKYYHIDLSNKFWKDKTTGIACVSVDTKEHIGCALSTHLKKEIYRKLLKEETQEGRAKLYAICIYLLARNIANKIRTLVICNDENFHFVRQYLEKLFKQKAPFAIISITAYRAETGRNIKSPADNLAAHYAKRELNERKRNKGIKLNVILTNFKTIKAKWNEVKSVSE